MPEKTNKIIVVTGVSRGLGRAMVSGFVNAGHTIVGTARNAGAIKSLSTEYSAPHRFDVVDNSSLTGCAGGGVLAGHRCQCQRCVPGM